MAAATLASRSPFRAVAHELLNPLASLRGCVETLSRDDVPADLRARLIDIVRRQSDRLDWLIRAAVAAPTTRANSASLFDASDVLAQAATLTGAVTTIASGEKLAVYGDPQLFQLGIEALLMAVTHGGAQANVGVRNGALHITSALRDTGDGAISWKIDLARTAFHRTGIQLRLRHLLPGLVATATLPDAPPEGSAS